MSKTPRLTSYVGVSRRYAVSDNASRKWVWQYEREEAAREGSPAADRVP